VSKPATSLPLPNGNSINIRGTVKISALISAGLVVAAGIFGSAKTITEFDSRLENVEAVVCLLACKENIQTLACKCK